MRRGSQLENQGKQGGTKHRSAGDTKLVVQSAMRIVKKSWNE